MDNKIKVIVTDFRNARFHGLYPAASYKAGEGQAEIEIDKELYERYKEHLKEHVQLCLEIRKAAGFKD